MGVFYNVYKTFSLVLNSWIDLDLSAFVPANCLAILRVVYTTDVNFIGFRKKGTSSNDVVFLDYSYSGEHKQFLVPVDANGKCQYKSGGAFSGYVEGYLEESEFGWFDTAIDKTPLVGSWQTITNNEVPDGSKFAIFINPFVSSNYVIGRSYGSTDTLLPPNNALGNYQIVPIDSLKRCEAYSSVAGIFKLVGYIKNGLGLINRTNKSLTVTGSYQTIDVSSGAPAGAIAALILIRGPGRGYNFNLRLPTNINDIYNACCYWEGVWIVGIDAAKQMQGKIQHTDIDFYLVGWIEQTVEKIDHLMLLGVG